MESLTLFTAQAIKTALDPTSSITIKGIVIAKSAKDAEILFKASLIYSYHNNLNISFNNFEIVALALNEPKCYLL